MAELELNVDPSGAEAGSRRARNALRGVKDQAGKTDRAVAAVSNTFKIFAAATVAAAVAFASRSVSAYREHNKALAEVSTLIKGTVAETDKLDKSAKALAARFGGDATEQVKAFYQAISAGVGGVTEATEFLVDANILAKGGVTDITTSVELLTTVTNAYSKSGLTAARASDILFTAVKEGKTTIRELSAGLGRVVAIAGPVGISLEDISAAIATLTAQGQDTPLAITGITAAISSIIDPSTEAAKLAKELGIEFGAEALEAKGLSGVLDEVARVTKGNVDQITRLVGGQEALKAVLPLVTTAQEKYKDALKKTTEATGAAAEAAEKVSKSLEDRLNVQLAKLKNLSLETGEFILERLVPAMELATGHSTEFALALAGIGAVVSVMFPVIGAVTVLGAAIIATTQNWKFFQSAGELALEAVGAATGSTTEVIETRFSGALSFLGDGWNTFGDIVLGVFNKIVGGAKAAALLTTAAIVGLPAVAHNAFVGVVNAAILGVETLANITALGINKVIEGVNRLRALIGQEPIETIGAIDFDSLKLQYSDAGKAAGEFFENALEAATNELFKDHLGDLLQAIKTRTALSDPRRGRGFNTNFAALGAAPITEASGLPTVTLPDKLTDQQKDLIEQSEIANQLAEGIEKNTFGIPGALFGLGGAIRDQTGFSRLNATEQSNLLKALQADRVQTDLRFAELRNAFFGAGAGSGESLFGGPSSFTVFQPGHSLGGTTPQQELAEQTEARNRELAILSAQRDVLNLSAQSLETDAAIARIDSQIRQLELQFAEQRLGVLQTPEPQPQIGILPDNIRVLGAFANSGFGRVPGSGGSDSVLAVARLSPNELFGFGESGVREAASTISGSEKTGNTFNISVGGTTITVQGDIGDDKSTMDNIGGIMSDFADQIVRGLNEQRS